MTTAEPDPPPDLRPGDGPGGREPRADELSVDELKRLVDRLEREPDDSRHPAIRRDWHREVASRRGKPEADWAQVEYHVLLGRNQDSAGYREQLAAVQAELAALRAQLEERRSRSPEASSARRSSTR